MTWFRNHYTHCDTDWDDEHSSQSNDECPVCGAEIEPHLSEDLTILIHRTPKRPKERWRVLISPPTAEYEPDYQAYFFDTEEEANLFAETHRE